MKEVGGTLRMSGGAEDRAFVVLQDLQPRRDIRRMIGTVFEAQPEIGAQERRTQFGNELFAGIAFIAEALAPEIAVKARSVFRPVGLMPISA